MLYALNTYNFFLFLKYQQGNSRRQELKLEVDQISLGGIAQAQSRALDTAFHRTLGEIPRLRFSLQLGHFPSSLGSQAFMHSVQWTGTADTDLSTSLQRFPQRSSTCNQRITILHTVATVQSIWLVDTSAMIYSHSLNHLSLISNESNIFPKKIER